MPKDKYLSIFLRQMEAIILQIYFATQADIPGIFPSFSWGIFIPDCSRAKIFDGL